MGRGRGRGRAEPKERREENRRGETRRGGNPTTLQHNPTKINHKTHEPQTTQVKPQSSGYFWGFLGFLGFSRFLSRFFQVFQVFLGFFLGFYDFSRFFQVFGGALFPNKQCNFWGLTWVKQGFVIRVCLCWFGLRDGEMLLLYLHEMLVCLTPLCHRLSLCNLCLNWVLSAWQVCSLISFSNHKQRREMRS